MGEFLEYRRVGLLDELRGLCILGVVLSHGMYNLINIFDVSFSFAGMNFFIDYIQPLGAGAFIFVSGIVSRYSKSNLRRGLITFGLGVVVSVITGFFIPSAVVRFGVLSLLGSGMILYGLLEKIPAIGGLKSTGTTPWLATVISALLFCIFYLVPRRGIGFLGYPIVKIPESFYQSSYLFPFGFPKIDFFSSDYFPLLPWIFLFFSGTFIGVYFRDNKMPDFFYENYIPFFKWLGKHSLIIYLLHQPIIYAIMLLLF